MKEFQDGLHKKNYYLIVSVIIALMVLGVVIDNTVNMRFIAHGLMVAVVSGCLLLYPRYENTIMRYITVFASTGYLYSLFYLYPEVWSGFVLLCFIPALSILFFDRKLFYFSLVLNAMLIAFTFIYTIIIDQGRNYPYLISDIAENIVNFIASQVILYYVFHLSNERMKKQRLYFEQIQQAERLKTTGQMAAAVAHEIRNPLTVVKGFLQYYKEDPDLNGNFKRNFSLMIDELHTAEHVITQFLAMAKPDQEKLTNSVDIEMVMRDVTELLNTYGLLNDNNIDLSIEAGCYVNANHIELKQLFINLIKNAIEASPYGTAVYVTVEEEKGHVAIRVMDNGKGMTQEEVNSLGTPFYSLKSKGTGLGLMICYNIVGKYNGTIKYESQQGIGTTVTVRFPLK
ncbi:sensor histidine kinase [Rossellomorea aquimaris]|uniref:histidine kinase n=1 Tax=Rossellomorea aquimaris TaxID=189382 RepID=A0A1J6WD00_9BACI|nr:HAMP domain-containing sensor histidine kinase [Rossellomorea aquimaris]OIU69752.1 two-component sensor histidine kinase [Rossellomorea aquimaris]